MALSGRVWVCIMVAAVAVAAFAVRASSQPLAVPVVDHIHIAVPDPVKAVEWYRKMFGGESLAEGADRLMYAETRIAFQKNDKAQPSAGTALDHIGFSVADLDAKFKEFEAAGVKVVTPPRELPGVFKLGFIDDPWGTRIEIVQDTANFGFHHLHLRAPDPEATLAWYKATFGGEAGKFKERFDGVKYGKVWVLAQKGEAVPSEGHAIDHIGFRTTNLDARAAELKAQNVKFTTDPRPVTLPSGVNLRMSFIDGSAGAKIELVQR